MLELYLSIQEFTSIFWHFLRLPLRLLIELVQGIVRGLSDFIRIEEMHFTHIRRRILKLKLSIKNLDFEEGDDKPTTLIVDASGLSILKK
jgi:hypothetical protein